MDSNSPRIAHNTVRTFSCDRSSRVRPCARTKASEPRPLTMDRSSLAMRYSSHSDGVREMGIVTDARLSLVVARYAPARSLGAMLSLDLPRLLRPLRQSADIVATLAADPVMLSASGCS